MKKEDIKTLTRNLSFIKDNITDIDSVMDRLIEDDILKLEDRARILVSRNPRIQVHGIVEIVLKKGATKEFIAALEASGNGHIIKRLKNIELSHEKNDFSEEDKTENQNHDENDGFVSTEVGTAGNTVNQENAEKLQKQLTNLEKENYHLREQQNRVRLELNLKEERLADLTLQVQNYKTQNEKLKSRLSLVSNSQRVNERLNKLEIEIKQKDREYEETQQEISEKDKEIETLRRECEKLRTDLAEKTNQISTLNTQMKALKSDLTEAKKERMELKAKLDEMNDNLNRKWSSMMSVLDARLQSPSKPIQSRQSEDRENMLPSLKPNQTTPFRFSDNRYSILPKDKLKSRMPASPAASPRTTTVNKKTAFIATNKKSFNKLLK